MQLGKSYRVACVIPRVERSWAGQGWCGRLVRVRSVGSRRRSMILRDLGLLMLFLLVLPPEVAYAVPITGITHLNNFRSTRSINDVGVGAGDFNQFGADVAPSATNTTIRGVEAAFTVCPNKSRPL